MSKDTSQTRRAAIYFVSNFGKQGPRVILLVGPRWTDAMRRHYGIASPPFYIRAAFSDEPDFDASGHPFGWIYKPHDMVAEESRWSTTHTIEKLHRLLAEQLQRSMQIGAPA